MILIAAGALLLVLAGVGVVVALRLRETPSAGHLVTSTDVAVVTTDKAPPKVVHKPAPKPKKLVDRPCWESFGGNPRRTLARGSIKLGRPAKSVWARGPARPDGVPADLLQRPAVREPGARQDGRDRRGQREDPLAAQGVRADRVLAGARA